MSPGNRFKSESFCTWADTDFNNLSEQDQKSVTRSALHSQGRATHERDWAGGFAAAIDGTANRGVLRHQIRILARISPFSVPSYVADTPEAPARTVRWRAINPKQLPSLAGNTRETIARFHGSFAVLFSRLFSRHASNSEGSHEKGLNNGTASNRDSLSGGNFLSEISSALAARILDWTGGAYLSS